VAVPAGRAKRAVTRRAGAGAVLIGVLTIVLAGCGSTAAPPSPERARPSATPAAEATGSLAAAPVQAPADGGPGPSAAASAPRAEAARASSSRTPFTPAELRLPSGRPVSVVSAGTRGDGALAVPEDPAIAGWWSGGSRPGDPYGTTVLAGHIDSRRYGVGALAELVTSRPGASVVVQNGPKRVSYRITEVERVPKADLVPRTGAFDPDGPARLVLITCGGAYDPATHHYADNVLITAVPVSS